jgi:2-phosphoglycerate kinase
MIYLIGGTPRSGKTSATNKIATKHPMHTISTDGLRRVMSKVMIRDTRPEALVAMGKMMPAERFEILRRSPRELLDIQKFESELVFSAVEALAMHYESDKLNLMIEGVAILPWLLKSNHITEYRALFIVNTVNNPAQRIIEAKNNDGDWMHSFSEEHINLECQYLDVFAREVISACSDKYPCIDRAGLAVKEVSEKANSILFG